jgi:uncharacterized RDD family membrane protein YckC
MRCPKCHYISFDASDRCRNCGYEFSLAVDVEALDLPIQTGNEAEGPLSDFSLTDLDASLAQAARAVAAPPPEPAAPAAEPVRQRSAALDLPLFKERSLDDDRPLVTPPAVPRPPLAVRKSSPPIVRPAPSRAEEPELDLDPVEDEPAPPPPVVEQAGEPVESDAGSTPGAAPLGRRAAATMLDVLLLAGVDGAILYFTLRLCGLEFTEIAIVPVVPFLSFLLLHNGGYFVTAVTLGGQTIGKMAFNIKVVPAEGWADRVPLGASVVRAVAWLLTVPPLGLGLLPALFDGDHRALHDRLAGTRVIRA